VFRRLKKVDKKMKMKANASDYAIERVLSVKYRDRK